MAEKMHISSSSVRRDLAALEKRGLVIRSYGGVELADSVNRNIPFTMRKHAYITQKKRIAAVAAKLVAESKDNSVAAIASKEAAELYGLSVIEENINQSANNTTRFAVFSRSAGSTDKGNNHFVFFFTVKNEAGALGKAISVIGKYGFNLKSLK